MFGSIFKPIGAIIGVTTGIVAGIALPIIAEALNITVTMAKEAVDSGAKTYEEIKTFHNLK